MKIKHREHLAYNQRFRSNKPGNVDKNKSEVLIRGIVKVARMTDYRRRNISVLFWLMKELISQKKQTIFATNEIVKIRTNMDPTACTSTKQIDVSIVRTRLTTSVNAYIDLSIYSYYDLCNI